MNILKGKSVFGGIAIGKIKLHKKSENTVKRVKITNVEDEKKRFEEAKNIAKSQLKKLYDKALVEVGEVNAQIFEVHQMMLDDLDYLDSINHMIESQFVNSEYAVAVTSDNFSEIFSNMDDEYMQERAADIKDISERIITILLGNQDSLLSDDEQFILIADDLAPSETVQLDKTKVLAFVTRYGSTSSHTAILARTMNIPALISVDFNDDIDGKMAAVNGYTGEFFIEPSEEKLNEIKVKLEEDKIRAKLLQELKGKEDITIDGTRVKLFSNIGQVEDTAKVLDFDAQGIGLFRSEFLYLESEDFPTEEDQFLAYKKVLESMAGKKVIIRTLDIGADKQVGYFNLDTEENPAMGLRAIRICLTRPEIFKTQLRALFRASVYGNLSIMYPMITSVEEIFKIKEIVGEVKKELTEQGLAYSKVEEGIMIETPASAIISDLLAKEVDFFSIGTNDLSQYTCAIDRQNTKLDKFFNPHHKAILRLIQMVCDNAHKNGIWVGICGELGADLELTETFLKMGVDELSVSPSMVLRVREKIRSIDLSK